MDNCYACKQPLKDGQPHKVSDCAEMLHRALDRANLQVDEMTKALKNIRAVLGTGLCKANKCEGCQYEMEEAAGTARTILERYTENRKCPSLCPGGSPQCEKMEGHTRVAGDVEHRNGQTVWFSE